MYPNGGVSLTPDFLLESAYLQYINAVLISQKKKSIKSREREREKKKIDTGDFYILPLITSPLSMARLNISAKP